MEAVPDANGGLVPAAKAVKRLRILHVNTLDVGGGAERIATELAAGGRRAGHDAWLAVGRKQGDDPRTLLIPDERGGAWSRALLAVGASYRPIARKVKPLRPSRRWFDDFAYPINYFNNLRGREDFHYPQTRGLLQLPPERPDVLHAHNLHGGYFDLRRLPAFSRCLPCIVTLHDEWLLTGHCAYAGACARWQSGCGACPDLSIYPAIRRDGTAQNWRAKADIYRESRLFVATPSRWLLDEAKRSMLALGMADARVIPNGIDTRLFRPIDKRIARDALGLPEDRQIVLASANRIRSNRFKDWSTLQAAMNTAALRIVEGKIMFIALGESGQAKRLGPVEIRFVPYEKHPGRVALYYQAADLFIHAAKSENFPTTVLEALACGTPVIATAVGGIPEQIKDLADPAIGHQATGVLVPPADAEAMAHWIMVLLADPELRARMADQGREDAETRFGFPRMLSAYLKYYEDALQSVRVPDKSRGG